MLAEQGRITTTGAGRATRYQAVGTISRTNDENPAHARQRDLFVPLSNGGDEIFRIINSPTGSRTPVAYNRAFLDDYRPNVTSYLKDSEKSRLMKLGTTQGLEQAAGTYALQMLARLLIDLSWSSSRLEGNTYSLLEIQKLIELGQSVEG